MEKPSNSPTPSDGLVKHMEDEQKKIAEWKQNIGNTRKYIVKYVVYYEVEVEAHHICEAEQKALGHTLEDFHDLTITDVEEVVE